VEVGGLLGEEVRSETLVSVEENSINIGVELSGDILGKELDLVDKITALGSLGRSGLLALFVVGFAGFGNGSWLDLGDVEAGSEGGGG